MKRFLLGFVCSFILALSMVSVAFASYKPVFPNVNSSIYNGTQMFFRKTGHRVLDVDPASASFAYKVQISYDDLSSICTDANSLGMSCSLYYNSSAKVYVIAVDDVVLWEFSSLKGTIGNVDGKVYTAEDPRSNTSITITTPTSPDYSDQIASISSNLDFLPIITDVCAFIAENQITLMDGQILIARFILDVIDTIDDFSAAVNNRLVYIGSRVASVDNHVVGISEQLASVIRSGQVQVNTTPLEARLDKLISMYSKVNSVILDTASVNGGQITGAVGGELQDVIFWGDTGKSGSTFLTPDGLWFRLGPDAASSTLTTLDDSIVLRSVNLGSTIPSCIADDPVLYAGVWQKGTNYIISDTYNASTGEYVQRIGSMVLPSKDIYVICDDWRIYLYTLSELDISICNSSSAIVYTAEIPGFSSGHYPATIAGFAEQVCVHSGCLKVMTQKDFSVSTPLVFCVMDTPIYRTVDPATIAIPEGSSYISSYNVRITGKYETYDSYAQTADIISGIGRTEALLSSINSYSSTISANVGEVNTALTSVIEGGKLKVDNSPVVTWLETINTTLTANGGHSSAVDLTTVETTLSKICDKLDNTASNVNNMVVNITNDNDKFNVFYITDEDGVTQPVTEFAGDLTGASGKLLSLLYRLVFSNALDTVGGDLSNFEDFFTSQEPVTDTAAQGMDDTRDEQNTH